MMNPRERAQAAVAMLKDAVLQVIATHPEGLRHTDIVKELDIPSDYLGKQKNYLSWSVVGLLVNAGKIRRVGDRYHLAEQSGPPTA